MRRVLLAIVSTVASLVVLLGFKTHAVTSATAFPPSVTAPSTSSTPSAPSTSSSPSNSSSASDSSGSSSSSSSAASSGTKTVTGDAADTRYGPVQVKITVTNGKITSADAVDYPANDPR